MELNKMSCCSENMPLVSICLLAYNHEKYISKAIESCLSQSYKNIEIIIVDNCSTDNTAQVIKRYSLSNERIKAIFLNENTYPSHGTNIAIKHSKGEFVSLLAGDDFYEPNKILAQLDIMIQSGLSNSFTWVNLVNDDNDIISQHFLYDIFNNNFQHEDIIRHFFSKGNMLCAASALLSRKLFDEYGLFDERLLQLQDYDFWLRILKNETITLIPNKLVNYRIRSDRCNLSLSNTDSQYIRTEFEQLQIDRKFLDFDLSVISHITSTICTDVNKCSVLYNYFLSINKNVSAKSVLQASFNSLGEQIEFPSENYSNFYNLYSNCDFLNSINCIELAKNIEQLKIENSDIRASKLMLERDNERLSLIELSLTWRLSKPIRILLHQVKRIIFVFKLLPKAIYKSGGIVNLSKKAFTLIKDDGVSGIKKGIASLSNNHSPYKVLNGEDFLFEVGKKPQSIFDNKVLIIAELSIPQCEKYRVAQKKEMFQSLGVDCEIVSWTDYKKAFNLIQLSTMVIFYRTPGYDSVLSLTSECKRLNIATYWEVDDLIFDKEIIENSRTIKSLPKNTQEELVRGAVSYKKAMLACDKAIASTGGLAQAMVEAGVRDVYIVENALDAETIKCSNSILAKDSQLNDGILRIVYGSGTSTHNIDFEEAADSIAKVLKEHEHVIFRLIGILELPSCFDGLESKIERIEFCNYLEYLNYLSECDISIAPLEDYIFNDAKSNIKFLEASIVKVPSVCSPRSAFIDVIDDGINGLIASNPNEWYKKLMLLVNNRDIRNSIASHAYASVKERYTPYSIATKQLSNIITRNDSKNKRRKRVITFNVFYHPRSFGGATVVAEQINKIIDKKDKDLYVVTTLPVSNLVSDYEVLRYEVEGVTTFGIGVPEEDMNLYFNPKIIPVINKILTLVQPDLAHIHCIQGLGVGLIDSLKSHQIKYLITLHDAWWICPKQFMINKKGEYCNQSKLDIDVCSSCYGSKSKYLKWNRLVEPYLSSASLLLAPSQYFADLHNLNSVSSESVLCNKNGIKTPNNPLEKRVKGVTRIGYVGGNTNIKGVHLVLDAFRQQELQNIELVIVDNLVNLGKSSFSNDDFNGIKNFKIVPAYNQENIDEFFGSIDILLFPTQWKESFGLTVREAIVRNVWVIATDAGGVIEDIKDNINGKIIPFNADHLVLAKAIVESVNILRDRGLDSIIELEKSSIRTFQEQADELNEIYDQIIHS